MADPCQIVCTSIFEQVGLINQQVRIILFCHLHLM